MNTRRGALLFGLLAVAGLAALLRFTGAPGPGAESRGGAPGGPMPPEPGGTAAQEAEHQVVDDQSEEAEICRDVVIEGARAIVCTVDPATFSLRLAYRDAAGAPYGSLPRAAAALARDPDGAGRLVLAMNAGMYHADLTPVGLYVEDSVEIAPLSTGDGFGNFFLKPNGVFFVNQDGGAGVMETTAYQAAEIHPAFATQSGPMLVIDGRIHPRFLHDGTSKYIRNGVGVRDDGRVVLAITRDPVSLGVFARLFRDAAACSHALFFDGAVSSLALGGRMVIDSGDAAGPVVAVFEAPDGPPA